MLITELVMCYKYKTLCEIGISNGKNIDDILTRLHKHNYSINKLYGIDPHNEHQRYKLNPNYIKFETFEYIKKTSDEAISDIEDNSLDLIFIDGLHTAEQIEKDIINYTRKIKTGGCIVGDDYNDFVGKEIKAKVKKIINEDNLNIIEDEKLENGKPNFLWWTFKNEKEYSKKRK